ncbi:hypothetical protein [Streptomyces palmae]|uniref:ATP-binding protein n=1 Tax=Streptomyces palmae TaxID=1701085 RepID=A0A4Z0HHX8_9ACTN|nr:hypothetical protein [Streptomyces palmae]TGB17074.1 hypothetical protein E4099_04015 [Streptomyces palmae]
MMQGTIKALGVLTIGATAVVAGSGSAFALGANVDGEGVVGPVTNTLQNATPDRGSVQNSVQGLPTGQSLPNAQGVLGGGGRGLLGGVPVTALMPDTSLVHLSSPGLLQ